VKLTLLEGIAKHARVDSDSLVGMDIPVLKGADEFASKLKPGDIILTKDVNPNFKRKIENLFLGKGNWSHSGIYAGDNKMLHLYSPLRGKSKGDIGQSSIREHRISSLVKGDKGRDLLALRVKGLSPKQRIASVARARALKKTFREYDKGDAIRSILFPSKNQEVSEEDRKKFMCTFLPAIAHKAKKLSDRSPSNMRPYDFINSSKTVGVAALDRGY